MKNKLFLTSIFTNMFASAVLFACLSFIVNLSAREKPSTKISICGKPPALDGVLDDYCWKNAEKIKDFNLFKSKGRGPNFRLVKLNKSDETKILISRDDKWLFIGIDCINPNMEHVVQKAFDHDDSSAVCHDESIEIFLGRNNNRGKYYHYLLSFKGIKAERRITKNRGKELGWNKPWAGKTKIGKHGWTAEIAIPLDSLNSRKPGDFRINVLRNKINVTLDHAGAKLCEKRQYLIWADLKKGAHEPENFGVISGMKNFHAKKALLPEISNIKTGDYYLNNNQYAFDIIAELRGNNSKSGNVKLVAKEKAGNNERVISEIYKLPPRGRKKIKLSFPVKNFVSRNVELELYNADSGLLMQTVKMKEFGSIISDVISEFNYYTSEIYANIQVEISSPEKFLEGSRMEIVNSKNQILLKSEKVGKENFAKISIATLDIGVNQLQVRLIRNGKLLADKYFNVNKFTPQPGRECKINHFNRSIEMNGKPIFLYGPYQMVGDLPPYLVDLYHRTGFNTILKTYRPNPKSMKSFRDFVKKAHENGFLVMDKFIFDNHNRAPNGVSISEQKKAVSKIFSKLQSKLLESINFARKQPGIIAYYSVDEPNLHNWEANFYLCELFYKLIKKHDPYHPVFGLFARSIPGSTRWFDVLGYDVYIYPDWEEYYSDVCNEMAVLTAKLYEKGRKYHQPIWILGLGTQLDIKRCPRPLSGQEQKCQVYTAIIYGAKGFMYYYLNLAFSKETWDALKEIGQQLKIIQPAILGKPVKYTIDYHGESFDPFRYKFPTVHAGLFRFPDGKYLLLAVNSKKYPAKIDVSIPGLGKPELLFAPRKLKAAKEAFSDELSPLGTAAYRFSLKSDKAINVVVKATGDPSRKMPAIASNNKLIARVMHRKNKITNPSFDWPCKIPGIPDFCIPFRVSKLDQTGEKDSSWFLDDKNPKFGKYSLRMQRGETDGMKAVWRSGVFAHGFPDSVKPTDYVFSFYARSQNPGSKLWVGTRQSNLERWQNKSCKLSQNWQRFEKKVKLSGKAFYILMQPSTANSTIWVDGLQLEKGNSATEFSDK